MIRLLSLLTLVLLVLLPSALAQDELLTVGERSGFKATATYDEVVELMDRIGQRSPLAHRFEIGKTHEGRSIPAMVIANPPVTTPDEAAEQARRGKTIVLLFGNIHAGEVCGKEALLMLARELTDGETHELLKDVVVLLVPIYNADGNERFSRDNRPGQVGPEQGMGQRPNAMGLDLNRDFVKMEAPETRALIRMVNRWDPSIIVDTHTTNGSLHRYVLTYAGPKVPAGDQELAGYVRDTMLPRITEDLEERGVDTFFYGNFDRQHENWRSFPNEARFGTSYFGLTNRIGILSEAYAYATYEERVRATLAFCKGILEDAAANGKEIRDVLRDARQATVRAGEKAEDDVPIRTRPAPADEKVTVAGWEERRENNRRVSTGKAKDYEVVIWDRFETEESVTRPYAYIYPSEMVWLTELLQRHGLEVHELREDLELDVQTYAIDEVSKAERSFQGHNLATVEVTGSQTSRWFEAGAVVVRTAQDLGNLAVYLLEPECEDGLTTWNYFDDQLAVGSEFPVVRVNTRTRMTTGPVRKLSEDREHGKRVTWEARFDERDLPNFNGDPIRVRRWIDEEHFLLSQDGDTWKVHARTGRSEIYAPTGDMASALARLPTITRRQAEQLTRRADNQWDPDLPGMVFDHENDLYFCDWEGEQAVRLTSTPEVEELELLDPSGRFVAFVRNNDLYVVDIQTQTERALTTGGTDILRNGKAGWVYFEEVFGRNWRTFWWAPDGSHVAFLETDSARVPEFIITDDWRHDQRVEMTRYPKPGDPNPDVRLGIVSSAGGSVRWVDMSDYEPGHLITGVRWTPDSETVRFYVQDRAQTWLDICDVGTGGGSPGLWLRDQTKAWIDQPATMQFLADGSVLMSSERSGWMHLYHYSAKGEVETQVTEGEWEARRVHHVDEKGGWVYLSGTKDTHTGSNLYRARLDGSGIQRLTTGPGTHSIELSPGGSMFVDSVSSFTRPTTTTLYATTSQAGANALRTLDTNPVYDLEEYELGQMEVYTILTEDGFPLEGYTIKPPDFDPEQSYPVWFMTYAGPHAPTVRDSWGGGRTHEQMLASMGYVIFRTDPRSASGRGAVSAWSAYKRLGEQEMADIGDAVRWLTEHEWVDASRVGMSGHSYGGFMTAYAMTHSDLFAAGIAGAPVTDWREYDTIYTERYMQTPSANVDGYKRTSVIEAAKDLKGRLLILHGDIDDNVHAQNTTRLVRALQQADCDFELMIYPGYRHGIFGMHYRSLTVEFMNRMLHPEAKD